MRNVVRQYHHLCPGQTHLRKWTIVGRYNLDSRLRCCLLSQTGVAIQIRGAKCKTTVKLKDLPQGALDPVPHTAEDQDEGPTYPTVVRQARNNMRKFDNCVVLTRVGSFYELYFEQAIEYGPLLNLKVAQKKSKAGVPSVPMAGFPFFQLDRFLKILVQDLSKYVAISEEFANNPSDKVKSGGLMFDRRVSRVITPGTLIDEKFMDPDENNFLLAVQPLGHVGGPQFTDDRPEDTRSSVIDPWWKAMHVGLAWLDLSTGEFLLQCTNLSTLPSAFARIGAKEVILSDGLDGSIQQIVSKMVIHDHRVLTYHAAKYAELPVSAWTPMLETPVSLDDAATFTPEEVSAGRRPDLEATLPLQGLLSRFTLEGPRDLAIRISDAIDEEGLLKTHRKEESENSRYISAAQDVLQNEGSAADLVDMPRAVRVKGAQQDFSGLETDEEDDWIIRAQSLSLRYIAGSGHVCHVKGAKDVRHTGKAALAARSGRSTKSTRTFYNSDWTELGAKMDMIKFQIRAEEQQVLQELREQVVANLVKLRRNAAVLDELDIGCAFANLAEEQGFTRPVLNHSRNHKIVGGRHPTVKVGLEEGGKAFVNNDCFVGEEERVWLITGPNMGGKSTFLRQNALISILAQTGCFVPAEHAELGIVDQIFSRVGSADDLFRDQSTFMVEMLETAQILNQATSRSFVIMDEIGRGTTPEDGIAIAFACLHHLHHHNQCRTLFATHFHVLAEMAKDFDHLACYCTDVAERTDGSFSYIHRLQRGVNKASHALKVARLAGIPESALRTAEEVLVRLGPPPAPGCQTSGTIRLATPS
ncbi:MAG: hypothetical protein Q9209_000683 [Squamulea sp. 1 TL-2023]